MANVVCDLRAQVLRTVERMQKYADDLRANRYGVTDAQEAGDELAAELRTTTRKLGKALDAYGKN